MSGKGCVSFSQTITMSGSRWGFISGYSESLFFKRLTRVTSVNWELCCGLCGGYSPRTKLYCSFLGTHVILLPSLQWEKPQSYLWRRKWQPSPVFLPGDTQEQRGLVGYSPWGQESDTTYLAEFKRRGECYFQAKANLPSSLIKSLFFLHSWELVWLGIELNVGNRTLELWRYCSTKQQATLLLRYLLSVWHPFPL